MEDLKMKEEIILNGVKKELETLEHMGNQTARIGFMLQQKVSMDIKALGKILETMSFSEHILHIRTLVNQLVTTYEDRIVELCYEFQKED
jgi:hypothetical protein